LADRLLEVTGTVDKRDLEEQMLDSNPIERQRGITIKLAPVRMEYSYKGSKYILNLIDTPGHVDFSYEVSRALAACEGVILVVDGVTGIQAQTVANFNIVANQNLKVIPVINKIDLSSADPDRVKKQLIRDFGFSENEIINISAKKGHNINTVIEKIIETIPPPQGILNNFRALVFSSQYDHHLGVIVYVRIKDGQLAYPETGKAGMALKFMATGAVFSPMEIGVFKPEKTIKDKISLGEVGYIATGLKTISLAQVGDTIMEESGSVKPIPGFIKPKPFVYLSLFPTDNDDYNQLRESLLKLELSDSSLTITPHANAALGKGFLCGFLGLLHAEITKERLFNEFNQNIVATMPTVEYVVKTRKNSLIKIKSAEDFPDPVNINQVTEPVMFCRIFLPVIYLGNVIQLCQEKRAKFIDLQYIGEQAKLEYFIPLAEMIIDFFDKLKSASSGYASLDYEYYEHQEVNAVKLRVFLNGKEAEAFSQITVREKAPAVAVNLVERLKNLIPRHQFRIAIQAAVNNKIIARADIGVLRKDVTAKLYGGDRTRKDKLLEAQKKGKKKMRQIGSVEVPQEVFLKIHRIN